MCGCVVCYVHVGVFVLCVCMSTCMCARVYLVCMCGVLYVHVGVCFCCVCVCALAALKLYGVLVRCCMGNDIVICVMYSSTKVRHPHKTKTCVRKYACHTRKAHKTSSTMYVHRCTHTCAQVYTYMCTGVHIHAHRVYTYMYIQ